MSAKAKKGVSKEELRRLMKQQKSEGTISHPLAKYNALGHLICTVCNCQVKSDRLWNPHLLSRSHKEAVSQAKSASLKPQTLKRSSVNDIQQPEMKRPKSAVSEVKPRSILKNSLVTAAYSSDENSEEEIDSQSQRGHSSQAAELATTSSSLPADFFDNGPTAPAPMEVDDGRTSVSDTLPEGFFDDPKADAKARHVEYVEKEDTEYEKFQAEIKAEAQISEQIKAEDDVINTEGRHIDEMNEQLAQWSKVNNILQRKEKLMKNKMCVNTAGENAEVDSSNSDDDLNDLFDWRTKKVVKR